MALNLTARVTSLISASVHGLLDKLEEAAPVAMLEQYMRELDQVIGEVRAELGTAVANKHLAQQQHIRLNKEHDELDGSINTGLTEGREDLARSAVSRQLDIEAQLPILESSLAQITATEKEHTAWLEALLGKKREMQRMVMDYEASRRAANSAATPGSGPGIQGNAKAQAAQDGFERTLRKATGLDGLAASASIDQAGKIKELGDMVRENRINERLAALKRNP
jgi:phage shock protein A